VPEEQRAEQPPEGVLAWLIPVWSTTDNEIIRKCGFDALLFLRYLRMMLKILLPVTCVVVPVLVPINHLSGSNAQATFLDVFSISNVAPRHAASRLWIHWALGTCVVVWVLYVVHEETLTYVKAKQRYTSRRSYQAQPSANTILVANIPETLLTDEKLMKVFDIFPGGVRDIHIGRDTRSLSSMLSTRERIVDAIELAETKLIAMCISKRTGVHPGLTRSDWTPRAWLDVLGSRRTGREGADHSTARDQAVSAHSSKGRPLRPGSEPSSGKQDDLTTPCDRGSFRSPPYTFGNDRDAEAVWRRYVKPEDRETTRLPVFAASWFPSLPLMGRKVDRIYHLRDRLQELNQKIELSIRDQANDGPLLNNAFVRFNDQIAAHLACQSVMHGTPHHMTPRILDVNPQDVIWNNLALGWRQRWVRVCVTLSASIGFIVLYAVPVAFTSMLANLDALASKVSWLSWLTDWPDAIKNVIQGVLPPALLQIILLLVPAAYRYLMHLQGAQTGTIRELGVQTWYFLFLFVQVSESSVHVSRRTSKLVARTAHVT
jgi:hypothetical protein